MRSMAPLRAFVSREERFEILRGVATCSSTMPVLANAPSASAIVSSQNAALRTVAREHGFGDRPREAERER